MVAFVLGRLGYLLTMWRSSRLAALRKRVAGH
jgi:hypothetical protein